MSNYSPGTNVHMTYARQALRETNLWKKVQIDQIGDGVITLIINNETNEFLCADTARLSEVFNSGRVPVNPEGNRVSVLAKPDVLLVPCANEGKTLPLQVSVFWNLVMMKDGGTAVSSPTENGAWHIFSVAMV
jgi:hypothetical protein